MNYIKNLSKEQQIIHNKLSLSRNEIKNIIAVKGKKSRVIFDTKFDAMRDVNCFSSVDMACSGGKNQLASSLYYIEPIDRWIGPQYKRCRMISEEEYFEQQKSNYYRFTYINAEVLDTFTSPTGSNYIIMDNTPLSHFYFDINKGDMMKRRKPIYRIHMFSNKCSCPGYKYNKKCKHSLLAKEKRTELRKQFLPILVSKFGLTIAFQISNQVNLY